MKKPVQTERSDADKSLEISRLEMRMAALSARMARPEKGDHPEQLQQEYFALARKIRELKAER